MSKRNHRNVSKSTGAKLNYLPGIDIVIPTYNDSDFLINNLKSIKESALTIPYSLRIVNNGGSVSEEVKDFLTSEFGDNGRILVIKENVGYPMACNFGVKHGSNREFVLISTADIVYDAKAIEIMYNEIKKDDSIGMIGPKLLFPEDSPHGTAGKVQHAGLDINVRGQMIHTFIGWTSDHSKVNTRAEVAALTGATFLVRRELWEKVGGFFEGYGKGTYEDCEMALTISSMGYKIMYEPTAVGTHYVNATKEHYPLNLNFQIFTIRCGGMMSWTEWRRL